MLMICYNTKHLELVSLNSLAGGSQDKDGIYRQYRSSFFFILWLTILYCILYRLPAKVRENSIVRFRTYQYVHRITIKYNSSFYQLILHCRDPVQFLCMFRCLDNPGDIVRKSVNCSCEIYSVYPQTPTSLHLYSGDPAYTFTRRLKLSWIIATTPVIFGKLIPGL